MPSGWGRLSHCRPGIGAVKRAAAPQRLAPGATRDFTARRAGDRRLDVLIAEGELRAPDWRSPVRAKLIAYQDASTRRQYAELRCEGARAPSRRLYGENLTRRGGGGGDAMLFKLMAYKDEYEVARLYTTGDFEKRIRDTFDGDFKINVNLAPPMFSKKDGDGHLLKREYGPGCSRRSSCSSA